MVLIHLVLLIQVVEAEPLVHQQHEETEMLVLVQMVLTLTLLTHL
jgi:hypothetical protein